MLDYDRPHGDDDGLAALLLRRPSRSLEAAARPLGRRACRARLRERGPRVVEPGRARVVDVRRRDDRPERPAGMLGTTTPSARAGIEDDGFRATTPTLRLQDMDRDGVRASVIYGPNLFGLPIADPELKAACLRALQRLGGRVQRARPRAPVRAAGAADARARRRRSPSSSASRSAAIAARSSARSSSAARDPAWERFWDAAEATGCRSASTSGSGTSQVKVAHGSWELAAFAAVGADAARRAARDDDLLRRARAPSRRCASCSPSRGIGWLPYFVSRMDQAAEKHVPKAQDYQHQGEAERDLPPPGLRDLRGGAARPAAAAAARPRQLHVGVRLPAPRQHLPALARGDRRRLRRPRRRASSREGDGGQLQAALRVRREPAMAASTLPVIIEAAHQRRRRNKARNPHVPCDAGGDRGRRARVPRRPARRSSTTTSTTSC